MFTVAFAIVCAQAPAPYPAVRLGNDAISMTVYRPDAPKPFYRGTRFDHAGVIANVKVGGHTVFGKWKPAHDPANNDDITGPCEEFGMQAPLRYADAKPGEPFLKIGVGQLVRPAREREYRFHHNYEVKALAPWTVTATADGVTFVQRAGLNDTTYEYTKVVALLPGKPGFVLRHLLKNTGKTRITTDVYNHNFFNVDADPIGPNYALDFPSPVKADKPGDRFNELARVAGNRVTFTAVLDKGSAHTPLSGLPAADDYRFALTHAPSKLKLNVRGTGAKLTKLNLWAVGGCVCPEPFVAIDVAPGKSQSWAIEYEFGK